MNARTAAPVRKVASGTLAGAITTVVVYAFDTISGRDLPDAVVAALVVIVSFGVAYLVPASESDYPAEPLDATPPPPPTATTPAPPPPSP